MSETRYTDREEFEPETVEAVEAEYEVEMAGLNDNEAAQVKEALSEAEFNNELDSLDVENEIEQAQFAEEDRAQAEELREEQVEAADAGDYDTARERAEQVEQELRDSSEEHGGDLDNAISENAHDVEVLSEADYQQEVAEDMGEDAYDYAELESAEGYDESMDDAYDAADNADSQAAESTDYSDTGGDQSIYTDN
ncbi:MAG: hypothetical protein NXH85_15565 [Pseudomonadaceae bacterium]|nr:hypothetical protein [Pseudomonadaceae bacterium]